MSQKVANFLVILKKQQNNWDITNPKVKLVLQKYEKIKYITDQWKNIAFSYTKIKTNKIFNIFRK